MKKKKANGEKTALRVGRIYLTWDSYLKPCIDIEVEDADILIESVNLILNRLEAADIADTDNHDTVSDDSDTATDDDNEQDFCEEGE